MHDDPQLAAEALRRGAKGYLVKSSAGEEMCDAVRALLAGQIFVTPYMSARVLAALNSFNAYPLTNKQRRVVRRVAQGLRPKQISYELGLSARTVESHKHLVMQLLHVHTAVELAKKAEQLGLLHGG